MRAILRGGSTVPRITRACSTSTIAPELITVAPSPINGVSILTMNSPKANIMTPAFLTSFLATIKNLFEGEKTDCKGLILTSAVPGIYSGGLDINVLYNAESFEAFSQYWTLFQELFVKLHTLPVPIVAAVNGHAAAAGCILALSCDYRVMAKEHPKSGKPLTIGIAAAKHGFCVPPYVAGSLAHIVGFRRAEDMLSTGAMLTAEEALAIHLVDEVVQDTNQAILPCLEKMEQFMELPSLTPYWITRNHARRKFVFPLTQPDMRESDGHYFFDMLQLPEVRQQLAKHVGSLGSKGQDSK